MDLPKNKDLKELNKFDILSFTEQCINILSMDIGRVNPSDDRFGVFLDNPNKSLSLSDLQTTKTFSEITDETALTYANKNVAVAWSGGIDSSLIVAALYKNKIDFKVTVMHEQCEAENPDMYEWVIKNCNIIELNEETRFNDLYDHVENGGSLVSGDPADQLFPSIRYNLMPGVQTQKNIYLENYSYSEEDLKLLTQSYPDEYFYNNIKERIEFNCKMIETRFNLPSNFADDVIQFIIQRLLINNLAIQHFYQLKWLVKFIFKYNKNLQRLSMLVKRSFMKYDREDINFVQYDFFDTLDYQAWAWTNLNNNFSTQSLTAYTYKLDAKQYIVDVTGLQSQLSLIKVPSL